MARIAQSKDKKHKKPPVSPSEAKAGDPSPEARATDPPAAAVIGVRPNLDALETFAAEADLEEMESAGVTEHATTLDEGRRFEEDVAAPVESAIAESASANADAAGEHEVLDAGRESAVRVEAEARAGLPEGESAERVEALEDARSDQTGARRRARRRLAEVMNVGASAHDASEAAMRVAENDEPGEASLDADDAEESAAGEEPIGVPDGNLADDESPDEEAVATVEDLEQPVEADPAGPAKKDKGKESDPPTIRDRAEARAVLECMLFTTVEPLPLRDIRRVLHHFDAKGILALLVELQDEYDRRGGGLQIVEVAGGYQMATRPRFAEWLTPFQRRKRRNGLSVGMLETLAIVAYKQPIIRAEIDAIRGVDSSGMLHALQDLGLVEVMGQKQVPGRPFFYGTTSLFLKYFGLKSLAELPSIDALREKFELNQ